MALSSTFLKNAQTELFRLKAEQTKLALEVQHLEGLLDGATLSNRAASIIGTQDVEKSRVQRLSNSPELA